MSKYNTHPKKTAFGQFTNSGSNLKEKTRIHYFKN